MSITIPMARALLPFFVKVFRLGVRTLPQTA
jgi:hypothetical protein